MKFTPRRLTENVNISRTSPIRELFLLLGVILSGALAIYITLGYALNIISSRISPSQEKKLASFLEQKFQSKKNLSPAEQATQNLVEALASNSTLKDLQFKIHIVESEEGNAFAMPAGNIVLTSALLKEVRSENELSMILAHELGHYAHRDHLRGLGRGLVLFVVSGTLFGMDSQITQFVTQALLTTDLKFSRRQEASADAFALDLLVAKYGHAAGATDFFRHSHNRRKFPRLLSPFFTHPHDDYRIEALNARIAREGYRIGEYSSLDLALRPERT